MQSRPLVVSFSGVDGAGKSTQIAALCQFLLECEREWKLYTFWDDVVAFARVREKCSIRLFRGDSGVGSPDHPIQRRDKDVKSWPLTLFRLFLYTADALHLRLKLARHPDTPDIVIFDRYIYDELANLPLKRSTIRRYIRLLARIAPKPDVAILLDAEPSAAVQRKPEYPLEFVRRNREAYLSLAPMVGMTVIPSSSVEEATAAITKAVSAVFRDGKQASTPSETLVEAPHRNSTQAGESPFFSTTSSH